MNFLICVTSQTKRFFLFIFLHIAYICVNVYGNIVGKAIEIGKFVVYDREIMKENLTGSKSKTKWKHTDKNCIFVLQQILHLHWMHVSQQEMERAHFPVNSVLMRLMNGENVIVFMKITFSYKQAWRISLQVCDTTALDTNASYSLEKCEFRIDHSFLRYKYFKSTMVNHPTAKSMQNTTFVDQIFELIYLSHPWKPLAWSWLPRLARLVMHTNTYET